MWNPGRRTSLREKQKFEPLSQNSSVSDQDTPFLDDQSTDDFPAFRKERNSRWSLYLNIGLFVTSVLFFAGAIIVRSTGPTDMESAKHMSAYSPAMEAIEYEWITYENEFSTAPTKYRGKPTAALEQAWTDLWHYGAFPVPIEKVAALNQSTDTDWRRVTPGDPNSPTVGLLEGFHQIHCLNLIRQYTYRDDWDYSDEPSWHGGAEMVRWHVDHCIETLRMNLMCTADVTPYLIWNDPDGFNGESPSFNTLHKCRKWEPIVDWVKAHVVFNGTAKEAEEEMNKMDAMSEHAEHHGHSPF